MSAAADELPRPDAPVIYVAVCDGCKSGPGTPLDAVPFTDAGGRDRWAGAHADARGHTVTIGEQRPATGTTITGRVEPDQAAPARGTAAAPLLAFAVQPGQPPALACNIPNRAGAAWLIQAAHACLLGRQGSSGIPEPHRVLVIGRVTEHPGDEVDPAEPFYDIRVDGVIGATGPQFGQVIGWRTALPQGLAIPDLEILVESTMSAELDIPVHLFSLILVADLTPADPPDRAADEVLRPARYGEPGQPTPSAPADPHLGC